MCLRRPQTYFCFSIFFLANFSSLSYCNFSNFCGHSLFFVNLYQELPMVYMIAHNHWVIHVTIFNLNQNHFQSQTVGTAAVYGNNHERLSSMWCNDSCFTWAWNKRYLFKWTILSSPICQSFMKWFGYLGFHFFHSFK